MAKYYVTFSCGHDGEVRLFGPHRERQRKLEWFEQSGLCPDCYKAHKQAEEDRLQAEEEKRLREVRQKVGLPELELTELTGTPKQVAWAEDIRREKMTEVDAELVARWHRISPGGQAVLKAARQELAEQGSAKWWIENRHLDCLTLIKNTTAYKQAKQND